MNELYHYGVIGQKWGVRRYQNADGSLTNAGLKKYRKRYDDAKYDQILSERSKTINRTSISSIDNYNSNYYAKRSESKIKVLLKKIGNKGLSQLDNEVIKEGKIAANKAKKDAELFNESLRSLPGDNSLFLKDPNREYDYIYNRYINEHKIKR